MGLRKRKEVITGGKKPPKQVPGLEKLRLCPKKKILTCALGYGCSLKNRGMESLDVETQV